MRVSDLAKELGISAEDILGKLKAMRLKAKDSKQELNEAVEAVIRREFKHVAKSAAKAEPAKAVETIEKSAKKDSDHKPQVKKSVKLTEEKSKNVLAKPGKVKVETSAKAKIAAEKKMNLESPSDHLGQRQPRRRSPSKRWINPRGRCLPLKFRCRSV